MALEEIVSAELVTFRPIRDFGGWGIRHGGGGWAYTVRGNRGVRLTLQYGSPLLIGSQNAEDLYQAIERARRGGQV
jgi:hypothetical protein